jgi:predicted MFS family arabinose efflux permease
MTHIRRSESARLNRPSARDRALGVRLMETRAKSDDTTLSLEPRKRQSDPAEQNTPATSAPTRRAIELQESVNDSLGGSRYVPKQPWLLYSERQRWIFLAILYLVTTSSYFDLFVVSILLEPIKQEFHVSDAMLGLLSGFGFTLFYAVASFPIARWADRGNRRTVITAALATWSAMTLACGLAQSFGQLVLARMGVGAAEPGATPPAQSLIADYFPPERRAVAIAVLTTGGSALGYLVGVGLGGYIAATHGWRMAFLLAGIPGLILVLVVRSTLPEPRVRLGFPSASEKLEGIHQQLESSGEAVRRLAGKRSFLYLIGGMSVFSFFMGAASMFLPTFMIRSLHATLQQVSLVWGVTVTAANVLGAVAGGWLADRLACRDARWYAWLAAGSSIAGVPIYWLALQAHRFLSFIAIDFMAEMLLAIVPVVVFAAIHVVCGSRRRAMAISTVYFSGMLIGTGLGPLIAGAISDAFSSAYGLDSMRYSLMCALGLLLPATGAFYWSSGAMDRDRED